MKSIMRMGVFLTAVIILLAGKAPAQNPLGRISGTVRDSAGAVAPGATVVVTNEGTGQVVQTVASNSEGIFIVPQVAAGSYTVKIELTGFKTAEYREVKVEPGREYSLVARLEIGQLSETVQVTAGTDLVNTTTTEISNTVIRRQIIDLPLNGRNPIELIRLQAGVAGLLNRTNTTINGGRPTWTQVTQDGINIQDNFIRTNSLDFVPNRPTSDTIGEFSITTNTQGADSAGGASQVKMVTPSGTGRFHGSLYHFNRNSALAANSWFNNRTIDPQTGKSVQRPFLNRNQFGGNIAGPVIIPGLGWTKGKDKLFFFFSYEGFRQRTQTTQNNTIAANGEFLGGAFRYVRPSDGTVQSINVLNPGGGVPSLTLDPKVKAAMLDKVPSPAIVNNYDVGNSTGARILNTAGYRFNQRDVNDRNQYAMRFDFQASEAHRFEFIHQRFKEVDDRTDLDAINLRPKVFTDSDVKLIVGAWRWTATPRLINELRIGANLAPVAFKTTEDYGGVIFSVPFITNRQVTFMPQGRDTRTRQWSDNATWVTGDHSIQFGGSLQQIRVRPYNYAGQYPTVSFGFSSAAPAAQQLTAANFPGSSISATDLTNANSLRSWLGGVITQVAQTFQVRDKTSGFVAGIPNDRNYALDNWSLYIQDAWRLSPNLNLRMGLKWEYFTALREDSDLGLLPVFGSKSAKDALLDPNGTVDFIKGGMYGKDRNNFGPTVGLAWDPFKDGKTSIRFGYTMTFVNEESVTTGRAATVGNDGLQSAATLVNQYTTMNAGIPVVQTPVFKVPRTYVDQLTLSPTAQAFGIDPKMKQPYVHQISFSVEREIGWNMAVEGRYVATMGRDIWRGLDYNQINAGASQAFLQDFLRARSNGFLALAATGAFNPAYNSAIAGSQQLTVIPNYGGGLLTNATVRSNIQTGQVASLADFYVTSRVAGAKEAFFPNPNIYQSNLLMNGGSTDYHALQAEVRRRFRDGIFGQVNYSFSKALTNSTGLAQNRFEPYQDNNRPQLEHNRAEFDVTHVLNGSLIHELPFGPGRRFLKAGGVLGRIVGGWQVSSIIHAQSGAPISILSGRGTFNRGGRSGNNPANSTLTRDQIAALFAVRKQADGRVFYIDPAVTDTTTGRAVGADRLDGSAAFGGQVFFHPAAGAIGQLQRLQFDGNAQFTWDFSASKRTRITETSNLELRADFFNFLNHPVFFVGDQTLESTQFGRITGLNVAARVAQVAIKLNF